MTNSHHATADYIAGIAEELVKLAEDAGLKSLAYLLDMSRLEARNIAEEHAPARERAKKPKALVELEALVPAE